MIETEFQCPLCTTKLRMAPGSQISAEDGVTLWCPSTACPAEEVMGHGRTANDAFKIVNEKYKHA